MRGALAVPSGLKFSLRWNPVLVKEMRARMRGPRAFVILTGFLFLLGVVTFGLYQMTVASTGFWGGGPPLGAVIGRSVFAGLAFFELFMVCLITPALTAGAISGERERRTLDTLLATPLHPWTILWGKLIANLSYVLLLILAAVPMASLVFLFGGVTPGDMIRTLIILILCAVTFGVLGLFFSVWFRRTGRATVASYTVLLALVFGIYFIYLVIGVTQRAQPPRYILFPSPVAAMASALTGGISPNAVGSLTGPLLPVLWVLGGGPIDLPPDEAVALRPLWHYTTGIYVVLTLILLIASVQLLKPIQRWRFGPRGTLGLIALAALLIGGGYVFYGPPSYEPFGSPVVARPAPVPVERMPPPPMAVREVVVRKVAEPTASVQPEGTAEPLPTLEISPDRTAEELGAIYVAAIEALLKTSDQPIEGLTLYDATDVGLLADPALEGSKPRRLPRPTLEAITTRLTRGGEISVTVAEYNAARSPEEALKEGGLPRESQAVIGLGAPSWLDDGRVKVPISILTSSGIEEVRVYTLAAEDGRWVVVEDSGVLLRRGYKTGDDDG